MEKRIENAVKNGAVKVNNAVINMPNVHFDGELESGYLNVQIDSDCVALDTDGKKTTVQYANISLYSILSVLKRIVKPSIYHHFQNHPKDMEDVLWKSKLTFIQEMIAKGELHTNIITGEKEDTPCKNDCICTTALSLTLSKEGEDEIRDIKMRMMLAR